MGRLFGGTPVGLGLGLVLVFFAICRMGMAQKSASAGVPAAGRVAGAPAVGRVAAAPAAAVQDPKCLLPRDAGPCRMRLVRYYYNAKTSTCETFTFGGCHGNGNRFGFRQTCEQACANAAAAATVAASSPAATAAPLWRTTPARSSNTAGPAPK